MQTIIKSVIVVLGMSVAAAQAAIVNLAASLDGFSEPFPIEPTQGFGSAALTLNTDTGEFAWLISFEQLTGPATLAHFHVAPAGVSGPVELPLDAAPGVDLNGIGSSEGIFSGSTLLDSAQIDEIFGGLWYINIHTELNPAGEIRGQVYPGEFVPSPVPLPAALPLAITGLLGLTAMARRRVVCSS